MIKLDFSDNLNAQDMIKIIENDKGLGVTDAINFSINNDIYNAISNVEWSDIALSVWGHDNPDRVFETLEDPYVEIELEESKFNLVNKIAKKENVDIETAVSYFLIFTMDSMGYHI